VNVLSPQQIARLLSEIAVGSTRPRSLLTAAAAGDRALDAQLAPHLDASVVGNLRQALASGNARTAELAAWKERLKQYWTRAREDEEKAALMVFYHAVVARAFGNSGDWITSMAKEESLALYEDLSHVLSGSDLHAPFAAAVERHRLGGA